MTNIKVHKNGNFTVMSNYHLKDKNISLKAKGLLSLMLSLPDNWDYSVNGLVAICGGEKQTAIKNTLTELKDNGYLLVTKNKNLQGIFEYEYCVYETPQNPGIGNPAVGNPDMDNPGIGNPAVEKPVLNIYTNKTNTNKTNTKKQLYTKTPQNRIQQLYTLANSFCEQKNCIELKSDFDKYIKNSLDLQKTLTVNSFQLQLELLNKYPKDLVKQFLQKTIQRGWINVEYVINDYEKSIKSAVDNTQRILGEVNPISKLSTVKF